MNALTPECTVRLACMSMSDFFRLRLSMVESISSYGSFSLVRCVNVNRSLDLLAAAPDIGTWMLPSPVVLTVALTLKAEKGPSTVALPLALSEP